jgi:magnesium-transporting ATPase (P-type)
MRYVFVLAAAHPGCCVVVSLHPRFAQLFGFSSERKMSCCVMRDAGKYTVYNKGAAEWVLQRCSKQLAADGRVLPLSGEQKADLIDNTV